MAEPTTAPPRRPSKTPEHERLLIEGPTRLSGELSVGGSKNTVLMMMPAALLAPGPTTIRNVAVLHDVWTLADAVRSLGCTAEFSPDDDPLTPEQLVIDAATITSTEPPAEFVAAMRASFYLLGALVGRCGEGTVGLPGGDAFGARPVNLHLEGLRAFGAAVDVGDGVVTARAPRGGLPGGHFAMEPSSVGATVNLLLAAVTARGGSRIENAAREPDVVSFGEMLQAMGAKIHGLGTRTLEIEGVDGLEPVRFRNAPDRIEAGTHVIAAVLAGTPGRTLRITGCRPDQLGEGFIGACYEAGIDIDLCPGWIDVTTPEHVRPVDVTTAPYPGFPTDLQAQWTVLMTQADGPSTVTDPIYPERFQHVGELRKMGADIRIEENRARITPGPLHGAAVEADDVRAGVALVLAGLIARGTTRVGGLHHLDRGYERWEEKLADIGADIRRVTSDE